jgi:membrane protease YdiL (CAAX protease family)
MNAEGNRIAAPAASTPPLVFACTAGWILAAGFTGVLGAWVAIGGVAVGLGMAVLLLDRPASESLLQPSPRLVLLGAVVGGSMAAATYVLYPLLVSMFPGIATDTALLYAAFRASPVAIAWIALAPVTFGEELVWRGVVLTPLVRRLGPWGGVTLAAAAYALACAPLGSPVLVAVALLCGLVWGALRAATASLVPTLVAHLVWDVVVLLWLPLDSN